MNAARSSSFHYIKVPCSVCGKPDGEAVYETIQPLADALNGVIHLMLCRSCGMLYASPRPDQDSLDAYYAGHFHASGRIYRQVGHGSRKGRLIQERTRFIESVLDQDRPGLLMDIGAGDGELVRALNLGQWRLIGLEPSHVKSAVDGSGRVQIRNGSVDDLLHLPAASCDAILLVSVLEHLFDPCRAMAAVIHALKPGGVLVVEVPDSLRPFLTMAEYYSFEHLSHFTDATLVRLLNRFGLEVIVRDEPVQVPTLRLAVRKTEKKPKAAISKAGSSQALEAVIVDYKKKKKVFHQHLIARLEPMIRRWEGQGSRVGIYGAGIHTRYLLSLVDFKNTITEIIDGDHNKHGAPFMNWTVGAPEDIAAGRLDAVVISSKDFQNEIYSRIYPYESQGIEIVKLYEG